MYTKQKNHDIIKKNRGMNMKKNYGTSVFTSICFIVTGLFLLFKSEQTIEIISYVLGGIIIALGVLSFLRYFENKQERNFSFDIVYGIISVIAGIVLISNPHALAKIIPFILGVWITISSALKVQLALQIKSYGGNMWKGSLIVGIIALLCGMTLIFNPFSGAVMITKVIGIFLIIYAILDIISNYFVNKTIKKAVKVAEK